MCMLRSSNVNVEQSDMKLTCTQGFLPRSLWFSKESMKRLSGDCIYKPDYKGLPVRLFHIFIRLPKASAAHDGSSGSHYLASIIISSF